MPKNYKRLLSHPHWLTWIISFKERSNSNYYYILSAGWIVEDDHFGGEGTQKIFTSQNFPDFLFFFTETWSFF
jgi:hypothetical protein